VRIDAKAKEPTDDEAADATEESESSRKGWVTVAEPNTTFDLMTLADGTNTLLGDAQVTAGIYNGFRLIIDPAKSSVTLNDDANTVIGGESIVGPSSQAPTRPVSDRFRAANGGMANEHARVKFDVRNSFAGPCWPIMQNGCRSGPRSRRGSSGRRRREIETWRLTSDREAPRG
jgi:hypothetical protein